MAENPKVFVQIPHNCPFREHNEETDELWCDYADSELDCPNETIMPQDCPLLKGPITVHAI